MFDSSAAVISSWEAGASGPAAMRAPGTAAVATARAGRTRWQRPAERLLGHVGDMDCAAAAATEVVDDSAHTLSSGELSSALADVDVARAKAEALTVRLVAEGLSRGLHTESALSPRDWVAARCPWLGPRLASDIVTVAHAVSEPVHAPLVQAVVTHHLSVRRAAAVLRALGRVEPMMDDTEYDQAVTLLLETAARPTFTDRDLKRASDFLISVVLPEKDHEARAHAGRDMRGVNESSLADGSYVRFVVTCDAEGAAIFRAVMASPLAAPATTSEQGPEKDPRSATQRRYDALITVFRRGLAGGEGMPTTPKAVIQVTMRWDVLRSRLAGTGTSQTGETLSPETVRRIACDADIIPLVLGSDNEIVNLGRAKRLVTPGQRRVLEHRDGHCSFPGCSTPAPWCDAHHVVHWSRNGPSDISNYALLCGRHHTLVHDRDLMATVETSGVRWHV